MYNSEKPAPEELPSTAQLLRSTILAFGAAILILVTVVLPAEYGIDPTGLGRVTGLTQMGEIKTQLAREAEADRRSDAGSSPATGLIHRVFAELLIGRAHAHDGQDSYERKTGEQSVSLAPGEGMELKLEMHKGDEVTYSWTANGAKVNFDLHGENEQQSTSYKKARGVPGDEGKFVAAFDGSHGWFWRNRTGAPITVTLKTDGVYGDIKENR